jgi:hypothetical protein
VEFGVFADLDEAGAGCKKIGIAEIPEIRFVVKAGIVKEPALRLEYTFS